MDAIRARGSDDAATNAADRVLAGDARAIRLNRQHAAADHRGRDAARRAPARPRPRQSESDSETRVPAGGGPWQPVYPATPGSPDERYEIALAAGIDPARVVIRATDLLQNVSSVAVGAR
jgi:hypothetical protein